MQQIVREKLAEVINNYGSSICRDKPKLSNLLQEYCPQQQAKLNLIITTLEETSVVSKMKYQ